MVIITVRQRSWLLPFFLCALAHSRTWGFEHAPEPTSCGPSGTAALFHPALRGAWEARQDGVRDAGSLLLRQWDHWCLSFQIP